MKKILSAVLAVAFVTAAGPSFGDDAVKTVEATKAEGTKAVESSKSKGKKASDDIAAAVRGAVQ